MEQITRKRKLKEPAKLEIAEVTFVLNRAIKLCILDYKSSNAVGSPVAGKALLAEYSAMEIFSGHNNNNNNNRITVVIAVVIAVPRRIVEYLL